MSVSLQRARPHTVVPRKVFAISRTASKSPTEAIGKPASSTSTPNCCSAWATSIFSWRFMLAPGDCSPSRSVVSKMTIRRLSLMPRILVVQPAGLSVKYGLTYFGEPTAAMLPALDRPGSNNAALERLTHSFRFRRLVMLVAIQKKNPKASTLGFVCSSVAIWTRYAPPTVCRRQPKVVRVQGGVESRDILDRSIRYRLPNRLT